MPLKKHMANWVTLWSSWDAPPGLIMGTGALCTAAIHPAPMTKIKSKHSVNGFEAQAKKLTNIALTVPVGRHSSLDPKYQLPPNHYTY